MIKNNIHIFSDSVVQSSAKRSFSALDWVVMSLYMILMLGIGAFFYWQGKRSKKFGSNEYLTAKGMKVPTIVVALSIYATGLSSLTFLGTPGLAFKTGWMWIAAQLTFLVIAPYIIKFIIPFYRRIKGNTAYVYLEQRFHYSLRAIGSMSFILFHIFRIGIVLILPTLALSLFVDINIYLILFIVAIVVVLSTFLGGFKGVMWSDAIQGVVFILGIILIIVFGLVGTNWDTAKMHTLFSQSQWKITWASGGIFFIFVSKYIENIFTYTASQDIVQRYKAGKTISTAYRSIYINVLLTIITILVFYGAGSVLYSYYSGQGINVDDPNAISVIVGQKNAANNQLLSYFIITVLPIGVSGLLISAVFAASQSTISSSLNSLVTSLLTDFVERFKKINEKNLLLISRLLTILFGLFGFLVGVLIALTGQQNLIQYFLGVVGLLGSPLASLFILGILTKRTTWQGALTGTLVAFSVSLPLWILSTITKTIAFAPEYLVLVNFTTSLVVSYCSSFVWSIWFSKQKDLTNLTIYTKSSNFIALQSIEKQIVKTEKLAKKGIVTAEELQKEIVEYERLTEVVYNETTD